MNDPKAKFENFNAVSYLLAEVCEILNIPNSYPQSFVERDEIVDSVKEKTQCDFSSRTLARIIKDAKSNEPIYKLPQIERNIMLCFYIQKVKYKSEAIITETKKNKRTVAKVQHLINYQTNIIDPIVIELKKLKLPSIDLFSNSKWNAYTCLNNRIEKKERDYLAIRKIVFSSENNKNRVEYILNDENNPDWEGTHYFDNSNKFIIIDLSTKQTKLKHLHIMLALGNGVNQTILHGLMTFIDKDDSLISQIILLEKVSGSNEEIPRIVKIGCEPNLSLIENFFKKQKRTSMIYKPQIHSNKDDLQKD